MANLLLTSWIQESIGNVKAKIHHGMYNVFNCFITSLFLARNLGHLTWVRHSSCKSSATHSCHCVQYFCVSELWQGCQCLAFLTCTPILTHAIAHRGCMDTVREFTLEADSGRKIPCRTGDLNRHHYHTWLFSTSLSTRDKTGQLTSQVHLEHLWGGCAGDLVGGRHGNLQEVSDGRNDPANVLSGRGRQGECDRHLLVQSRVDPGMGQAGCDGGQLDCQVLAGHCLLRSNVHFLFRGHWVDCWLQGLCADWLRERCTWSKQRL